MRSLHRWSPLAIFLASVVVHGCTGGAVGNGSGNDGQGGAGNELPPTAPIPQGVHCDERTRPAWKLSGHTAFEVQTIVGQVFGTAAVADAQVQSMLANLPTDLRNKGFDTENHKVSQQFVDAYVGLVRRLARLATEKKPVREAIESFVGVSCDGTLDLDTGCGVDVAKAFARHVASAIVPDDELGRLTAQYADNKGKYQSSKAYAGFVASVLLGARSALRFDAAQRDASGVVDAQTLGFRLSMTLTGGLPDRDLRKAISDQSISRDETLAQEAKRLLATEAGHKWLSHFAQQWLNVALAKSPPPRAGYVATDDEAAQVAQSAREEVGGLFADAVVKKRGSLANFYATDDVRPSNAWLAKLYQTGQSNDVVRAKAPSRHGLLTRAAFNLYGTFGDYLPLAHRGYGIKVTMLCGSIGALPDMIDKTLPASSPDVMSSREYFSTLTERGTCIGCHAAMNPFGFSLSAYSVTGEYLTKEVVKNRKTKEAVSVDVAQDGRIDLDRANVSVANAGDMSDAIGDSLQARACFALRLDQAVLGGARAVIEDDGDVQNLLPENTPCSVKLAAHALGESSDKGALQNAILAYVTSLEFKMQ